MSDPRWYVIAVHYPTSSMARRAFDRLEARLDLSAGDEGIGIYRMAPKLTGADAENMLASGAPEGVHPVVCVTLDERTARKAERIVRDGTLWQPTAGFTGSLIARRARVVLAHAGEAGRLVIRRGEGRGGRLSQDGTMHEQDPGQG